MPEKLTIYAETKAKGWLEGLDGKQRKKLYAQIATGRISLTEPTESVPYTYLRLGTVKEEEQDEEVSEGIAHEWTLIGWFHHDKKGGLQLSEVHAWKINGMLIGDCDGGYEVKRITKSVKFEAAYESAGGSRPKLLPLLNEEMDDPAASVWRVPKLPTYSDNDLNMAIESINLGVQEGVKQTNVAVRFVNQLENGIVFPIDVQMVFRHKFDDYDAVCKKLSNSLKSRKKVIDQTSSQRLFEEELVGEWEWELWVLPQLEGMTELYRFSEGGDLKQFLGKGKEGDADLYLEAHIVET